MKLHAALRVARRSELRCLDLQRGTRRRLRPVRALCSIPENLPEPAIVTSWPFFSVFVALQMRRLTGEMLFPRLCFRRNWLSGSVPLGV